MMLPDHVRENLIRSHTIVFPNGASPKRKPEFVYCIVGSISNAYRKCDLPVRLGLDAEVRTLTGLTICTDRGFRTVPILLMGGVVNLGRERVSIETPDSVALLVRTVLNAIQAGGSP